MRKEQPQIKETRAPETYGQYQNYLNALGESIDKGEIKIVREQLASGAINEDEARTQELAVAKRLHKEAVSE